MGETDFFLRPAIYAGPLNRNGFVCVTNYSEG